MSSAQVAGPELSVVVAAAHSQASLEACLASLKEQAVGGDTEVIAVCNCCAVAGPSIEKAFPFVRLIEAPPGTTVPELRGLGIQAATGRIVALLEDNSTVAPTWSRAIIKAHAESHVIVGGPVERVGTHRAVDWAVYFYEYGKYMLPCVEGESAALSGNNVSYQRALLQEVQHEFRDGFFEAFLHERLRGQGRILYMAPDAVVCHTMNYRVGEVLMQTFHHGRHYAGKRVAAASGLTRLGFAAGSTLLPLILPLRIAQLVLNRRRHLWELTIAMPYLVLFMASWACGELMGYVCGEGESVRQWT
ncbi:MAG: glycosyltransferase [Nitrospira sp.]